MTPSEFLALHTSQQADLLYDAGIYLGKIKWGYHTRLLYQLDYFYVEISYRKYRRHVLSIQCFDDTALLDPYLENISLEELINCCGF